LNHKAKQRQHLQKVAGSSMENGLSPPDKRAGTALMGSFEFLAAVSGPPKKGGHSATLSGCV